MKLPTDPSHIYTSPKGRQFRVVGVEKLPNSEKWIGQALHYKWTARIRFLDNGKHLDLFTDHYGNVKSNKSIS